MLPDALPELPNLCVAFGIGLLIGVERERSKGDGPDRRPAGMRTFLLVALIGAIAERIGGVALAVGGGFVALAALSKSATPKRVRESATRDHPAVLSSNRKGPRK